MMIGGMCPPIKGAPPPMPLLLLLTCLPAAEPAEWEKAERKCLRNIKQVTSDDVFSRAGEGYFSPDGKTIIFQAEEKGTGNPFYQIFTLNLATGRHTRVSPGIGKTTCAFFHPDGKRVIWASTHLDPKAKEKYAAEIKLRQEEKKSGKRRRYVWDFDPHFDIFESKPDGTAVKRLTKEEGYDAEGSYSADGKKIVFTSNRSGEKNLELYVMDADGKNVRKLTDAPGCYNGGPFFSPDGKRVIFRSDRKKKDHLQLYVIDADGKNERALTDDLDWVQWAPYWCDNKHIVYTAANHKVPGRPNYDIYYMNVDTKKKARVTFAPGADVLPVPSPDGKRLMWTSTRDGRGPAQLYIADWTPPKLDD
jgi:Tol biopolymer transport system component